MGTKANPGAYDCFHNAEPDEPLFVLLARDRHAPQLVREWAGKRSLAGEDIAVVKEALACADAMELWRSEHRGDLAACVRADIKREEDDRLKASAVPPPNVRFVSVEDYDALAEICQRLEKEKTALLDRLRDAERGRASAEQAAGVMRAAANGRADVVLTTASRLLPTVGVPPETAAALAIDQTVYSVYLNTVGVTEEQEERIMARVLALAKRLVDLWEKRS